MQKTLSNITKSTDRNTLFIVFSMAIVFMFLSVGFMFLQLYRNGNQVSGLVTAVSGHEIIIENSRGEETVLVINESTQFRDQDEILDSIPVGVFIHSFGDRISDSVFESKKIRIIRPRS